MSIVLKQIPICEEMDSLLGLMQSAIIDVKAGKGPIQVGADLLPEFLKVLKNISELKVEIADRKDLERTVALKVTDLVDAMYPPVVPL